MNVVHSVKTHIRKTQGVVTAGDNAAWEGLVAAGVGKRYLWREGLRLHIPTLARGLIGARAVERIAKSDPVTGPAQGLREFYRVLIENRLGREYEMHDYSVAYITKRRITVVEELLRCHPDIPKFLSTTGGSTGAAAATEVFGFWGSVSNRDLFDQHLSLTGVEITISTPEQKLKATVEMLRKYEIGLGECAAIGDSEADLGILQGAKLSISSPFAVEAVRKAAKIHLELAD